MGPPARMAKTQGSADPLDPVNPKRNAILEAAAHLFLERGYGAVTMDAIAAAAGVSKRTVYSYFPHKEELFAAIMQAHCESFGGIALPAAPDGQPPRAVLTHFGRTFVRMITAPRAVRLQRVLFSEVERMPEIGQIFWRHGPQRHLDALGAYLSGAVERGELAIANIPEAAMVFMSQVKSPFHLKQLCDLTGQVGEAEIDHAVATAVEIFVRAYEVPVTRP